MNGKEVARRNVPQGQGHRTPASQSREAGAPETLDLSAHVESLRAGLNVLAVEVHNREIGSSDLSIVPELLMAGGI